MLIGEPGVGKTAVAEGLAQRIVAGDIVWKMNGREVYDTEQMASLLKKNPTGKVEFYRLENGSFNLHSTKMPADDCQVIHYPIVPGE